MEFIKGMDISSLIEEEQCGAKYYMDGVQMDLLKILKIKGCNYCRLRLWNNPYDEEGTPYGAGSNDMAKLIELSRRVKAEGMKILLDYHYSDFWADPKRQNCPKAWEGMEIEEKCADRISLMNIVGPGEDLTQKDLRRQSMNTPRQPLLFLRNKTLLLTWFRSVMR